VRRREPELARARREPRHALEVDARQPLAEPSREREPPEPGAHGKKRATPEVLEVTDAGEGTEHVARQRRRPRPSGPSPEVVEGAHPLQSSDGAESELEPSGRDLAGAADRADMRRARRVGLEPAVDLVARTLGARIRRGEDHRVLEAPELRRALE